MRQKTELAKQVMYLLSMQLSATESQNDLEYLQITGSASVKNY